MAFFVSTAMNAAWTALFPSHAKKEAYSSYVPRFQQALQVGAFDVVTGDVARLSGRHPESVEDFLSRSLGKSTEQSAHA